MKFGRALTFTAYIFIVLFGTRGINAQGSSGDQLAQGALKEFQEGKYNDAERDFREMVKRNPSNLYAQFFLGQSLFRQQKFGDAVGPFEKARDLQRSGKILSLEQKRILIDQLAMSYGLSGQMNKAFNLLEDGVREDPDYPLNYYNLACAYAEKGDRDKMLSNLSLAFKHKEHVLKGEQLPNPRSDSSFQKYLQDERFVKLMSDLGYK